MSLKVRTVAIIKSLNNQGKKSSEINKILISQGLIKKKLSYRTIRLIKNGDTHADIKPFDEFVGEVKERKDAWSNFYQEAIQNFPEVVEQHQIVYPKDVRNKLEMLKKYVDSYELDDKQDEVKLLELAKKYNIDKE